MFRLWTISTCVLSLQLVVGGVVFYFSGDLRFAALFAALAASLVAIVALIDSSFVSFVELAASFAALVVSFAGLVVPLVFSVVFAVFFVIVAALYAKRDESEEYFLLLFIASLPAGIGTFLGGAILLFRRLTAGEVAIQKR